MIKKLSNIIKEDRKERAINKLLGCTCYEGKPISDSGLNSGLVFFSRRNCPIHGWRKGKDSK